MFFDYTFLVSTMTNPLQRTLLSLAVACAVPPAFAQAVLSVDDSSGKPVRNSTLLFTISRTGPTDFPVTVSYATRDGSAVAGRDYTDTSGTATLEAGQSSVSVLVPLTAKLIRPTPRSFTLELSNPVAGASSPYINAGNAPGASFVYGSVTADFNGDRKPDWVLASFTDSVVNVLRNDTTSGASSANLTPALTLTGFVNPTRPSVGDFNGDGRVDVAVPNFTTGNVEVLLNTTPLMASAFSFTRVTVPAGTGALSSAVADLDGDGRPDILVASTAHCAIGVVMNRTPAGATVPVFDAPVRLIPAGDEGFCQALTTIDADGDGKADIAVSDMSTSRVVVLRNTTAAAGAAPSFAAPVGFTIADGATGIASADIDGDGKPDLVTANNGFETATTFSVLLNRTAAGATTPTFTVTSSIGPFPYGVALQDLDADGKVDMAFTSLSFVNGDGGIWLLKNTTAPGAAVPTWTEMARLSAGDEPYGVVIADFNTDGKPDLGTVDIFSSIATVFFRNAAKTTSTATIGDGVGTGTIEPRR